MSETAELRDNHEFPVAIASKEGAIDPNWTEPKLFYVWVFSPIATDYVPVAVFTAKAPADDLLMRLKDEQRTRSGAVLELSWQEFVLMYKGQQYQP